MARRRLGKGALKERDEGLTRIADWCSVWNRGPSAFTPLLAAMRGVVLALAAATLGVEAWTVMTSAIDRPLTTASPRRKRHRAAKALPIELESRWAAKALPIELESPIEEAAVGEEASRARRPPAKALRSRRRRQRAAPAPPSTVQNVTDEWLGQAAH